MCDQKHRSDYLSWMRECKYPVKLTLAGGAICGESKKHIPRREVAQMLNFNLVRPYWDLDLGICLELTNTGYLSVKKTWGDETKNG